MFKIYETLIVNWNANTANTKQLSVSETPVAENFEKRALQARGEVRGKGKNKQKQQQQQQKRGETAKIRLQSESRDGLAGTGRLCFFLRPYPIFLSSNFSAQCGACPRLPRPSLAAVLCGVGSQIVRIHRKPKCDTHGHFCRIFGNIAILINLHAFVGILSV